ncbi:MAG: hypothetical protein H7Y86_19125 [Rhizobacter sp.]|nr:hypothetical protein [Ferruginibacter sp.]
MKKLIIAAISLLGFSAASFAQTANTAKRATAAKMQVVKKPDTKVVAMKKVTQPTVTAAKPTAVTKTVAKPASTATVAKTSTTPLKKDGTPDKRFKASKSVASGPLKKDGTPDKRFKANKKNS